MAKDTEGTIDLRRRKIDTRTSLTKSQLNELRLAIWKRAEGKCEGCSVDLEWGEKQGQLHHIDMKPRHNEESNLTLLCRYCHFCEHYYDGWWLIAVGRRVGMREFEKMSFHHQWDDCLARWKEEHNVGVKK